jgi:hypothetical protein
VGLVDRWESQALPNRGNHGLPVHPEAESFLDTGVGVGAQTLTEEGLHLSLADLTVHVHGCRASPDPATGWVAGGGVVAGQCPSMSAFGHQKRPDA